MTTESPGVTLLRTIPVGKRHVTVLRQGGRKAGWGSRLLLWLRVRGRAAGSGHVGSTLWWEGSRAAARLLSLAVWLFSSGLGSLQGKMFQSGRLRTAHKPPNPGCLRARLLPGHLGPRTGTCTVGGSWGPGGSAATSLPLGKDEPPLLGDAGRRRSPGER